MLRDLNPCKPLNLREYTGRRRYCPYMTCAPMAQIGVHEAVLVENHVHLEASVAIMI